ncbi:membrane protein ORF147A [Cyprinid herpesvirus 1]|uniref:Membrane protein ORF147A n=1 Tax=Cyprinid herpesvirus 1 TaxID=317858 RepID=K7PCL9_9VIRU|nr:membrane protein ORF147A [Cyprinid herpesvirus 1]AFJ20435.1 membrane protein ORF147A [Cyprinid herpesvirus 1]
MMVKVATLLALFVSARVGESSRVPARRVTCMTTEFYNHQARVCCSKCPPGTYLSKMCTVTESSICLECPHYTFTAQYNGLESCLPCTYCNRHHNLVTERECTRHSDSHCKAAPGHKCHREDSTGCVVAVEQHKPKPKPTKNPTVEDHYPCSWPRFHDHITGDCVHGVATVLLGITIPTALLVGVWLFLWFRYKFEWLWSPCTAAVKLFKLVHKNASWKHLVALVCAAILISVPFLVDVAMKAICQTTINVYTYPLGLSIHSDGTLSQTRALLLDSFWNRCYKQNEFILPSNTRLNKAIKCVKTTKEHKLNTAKSTSDTSADNSDNKLDISAGVSGSYVGFTASVEARFSKAESVQKTLAKAVRKTLSTSISSFSYQCEIGTLKFASFEPSSQLKHDIQKLNADPFGVDVVDDFLVRWGVAVVTQVVVGGYYSSISIFSTCDKSAQKSLDEVMDKCTTKGGSAEVGGYGMAVKAAADSSVCNANTVGSNLQDAFKEITKESKTVQIGGEDISSATEWQKTLKYNPTPLTFVLTAIYEMPGLGTTARLQLKSKINEIKTIDMQRFADQEIKDFVKQCSN